MQFESKVVMKPGASINKLGSTKKKNSGNGGGSLGGV